MELLKLSNLRKEKLAWLPLGGLLLGAFLFSVFGLVALLENHESFLSPRALSLPYIDYRNIGKGPFAITPKGISPEFEHLVRELVLLGKNTRPDRGALSTVSIGIKTSGVQQQLIAGQKQFLAQQGTTYQFTEEKTDLSIQLLPIAGSEALLQIEASPDKKEEVILTSSPLFEKSLEEESYVQSLKKAKMWAPDLFLHQWGGEEYRDLSAKHKLEIDNKVYFLSVGDLLWWDEGEWKIGTSVLKDAPLAKFLSTSVQGMTIEVWDPSGYISSRIYIPLQQGSKIPQRAEEAITSVRPRSPSEITCQLGKRRVIVKEGDWWIKTDRRWRSLKTADDLEAFLHHDIQGELFIFEKIENLKGKTILKGRCFDKMRTESQALSLVINTDKKPNPSPTKNGLPRPAMIAKNKMAVPPIQRQKSDGEEKQ